MKPDITCCDPKLVTVPRGWCWVHAKGCSVDPNQRVRTAAENKARELHPAGKSR